MSRRKKKRRKPTRVVVAPGELPDTRQGTRPIEWLGLIAAFILGVPGVLWTYKQWDSTRRADLQITRVYGNYNEGARRAPINGKPHEIDVTIANRGSAKAKNVRANLYLFVERPADKRPLEQKLAEEDSKNPLGATPDISPGDERLMYYTPLLNLYLTPDMDPSKTKQSPAFAVRARFEWEDGKGKHHVCKLYKAVEAANANLIGGPMDAGNCDE